jgi:hypothetical protein
MSHGKLIGWCLVVVFAVTAVFSQFEPYSNGQMLNIVATFFIIILLIYVVSLIIDRLSLGPLIVRASLIWLVSLALVVSTSWFYPNLLTVSDGSGYSRAPNFAGWLTILIAISSSFISSLLHVVLFKSKPESPAP